MIYSLCGAPFILCSCVYFCSRNEVLNLFPVDGSRPPSDSSPCVVPPFLVIHFMYLHITLSAWYIPYCGMSQYHAVLLVSKQGAV